MTSLGRRVRVVVRRWLAEQPPADEYPSSVRTRDAWILRGPRWH